MFALGPYQAVAEARIAMAQHAAFQHDATFILRRRDASVDMWVLEARHPHYGGTESVSKSVSKRVPKATIIVSAVNLADTAEVVQPGSAPESFFWATWELKGGASQGSPYSSVDRDELAALKDYFAGSAHLRLEGLDAVHRHASEKIVGPRLQALTAGDVEEPIRATKSRPRDNKKSQAGEPWAKLTSEVDRNGLAGLVDGFDVGSPASTPGSDRVAALVAHAVHSAGNVPSWVDTLCFGSYDTPEEVPSSFYDDRARSLLRRLSAEPGTDPLVDDVLEAFRNPGVNLADGRHPSTWLLRQRGLSPEESRGARRLAANVARGFSHEQKVGLIDAIRRSGHGPETLTFAEAAGFEVFEIIDHTVMRNDEPKDAVDAQRHLDGLSLMRGYRDVYGSYAAIPERIVSFLDMCGPPSVVSAFKSLVVEESMSAVLAGDHVLVAKTASEPRRAGL